MKYLWSSLKCDTSNLSTNRVKKILIHTHFKMGIENKIRPPIILTHDDQFFYSSYNSDGSIQLVRHDELSGKGICSAAYGRNHGLALTITGKVYSFGSNAAGQLGIGTQKNAYHASPNMISLDQTIKMIGCGPGTSFFLTQSGVVYACGRNERCQIADGTTEDKSLPTKIEFPSSTSMPIQKIFVNSNCPFALDSANKLLGWGSTEGGWTGTGSTEGVITHPKEIVFQSSYAVKYFAGPWNIAAAILQDNSIYVWGRFNEGQNVISSPIRIPIHLGDDNMIIPSCFGVIILPFSTLHRDSECSSSASSSTCYFLSQKANPSEYEKFVADSSQKLFDWLFSKMPLEFVIKVM